MGAEPERITVLPIIAAPKALPMGMKTSQRLDEEPVPPERVPQPAQPTRHTTSYSRLAGRRASTSWWDAALAKCQVSMSNFDVGKAQCFDAREKQHLISVIEAGFGNDLEEFNLLIRKIFSKRAASSLSKQRATMWRVSDGELSVASEMMSRSPLQRVSPREDGEAQIWRSRRVPLTQACGPILPAAFANIWPLPFLPADPRPHNQSHPHICCEPLGLISAWCVGGAAVGRTTD